jgi:CubicO group peptidase (beta-lactamase class C family)
LLSKLRLIGGLLLAGTAAFAGAEERLAETSAPSDHDLGHFEAYLDGVMAAQFRDYQLVGMTFALVRSGELVLSKGYGVASLESGDPVDPAMTLFRPGSVSKLFTWTAVMQLVEQGRLDLNAPIREYVDQFEIPDAFGVPLTLTHVMTHAPGFEDGAAGFLFADEVEDLVPLAESLAAHVPNQIWEPGTFSAYNNWSTALAGLIVANVSGMSFEDYVAEHIFAPLGMRQSTFEEPLPKSLAPYMAQGYTSEHGGIEPMGFEFIKNFGPAGALSAAAEDMARFIVAHVTDGGSGAARILAPETVAQMHSRLFAHDERVTGMAHGFYEIVRNGVRFIGHGGDTIAFHSELVIHPQTDFGLFVSFNTPEGAQARTAVVDAVLDYFYPGDGGAGPAWPDQPLAGSAERIAKIAGAYRLNRRSFTKLEGVVGLAGDLNVAPGPEGEIVVPGEGLGGRFIEVAPYQFRLQGRQETLVFQTDADGTVQRALVGSLPIMVADRLSFWETAANHQLVIVLALISALFLLINAVRSRGRVALSGLVRLGRISQVVAAVCLFGFLIGLSVVFADVDMNMLIFDFPPPGTGLVLWFPVLMALATLLSLVALLPVWRADACNVWQRLRYTWVSLIFVLLIAVLAYWNLLGWRY